MGSQYELYKDTHPNHRKHLSLQSSVKGGVERLCGGGREHELNKTNQKPEAGKEGNYRKSFTVNNFLERKSRIKSGKPESQVFPPGKGAYARRQSRLKRKPRANGTTPTVGVNGVVTKGGRTFENSLFLGHTVGGARFVFGPPWFLWDGTQV